MIIDVSIGIIFNEIGQVLLSLRNKNILSDYWEFPGGKREENENLEGALKRELYEEIKIKVLNYFLIYTKHVNLNNTLYKLNFYRIVDYIGEPLANENQELLWLEPEKLNSINLLNTNNEIAKILKNPLIIGISCAELLGTENFINVFKKKLRTRALDILQIRDKTLDKNKKENLFIHLNALSKKFNLPVVINDDLELAEKYSVKLIHLSHEKSKTYEKNHLFEIFSIAHHKGQNMEFIAKLKPRYIQLGPVFRTNTHLGGNNIGIENCKDIILRNKEYKYIAVGGISLKIIPQILESGFSCVASRTKFWNAN